MSLLFIASLQLRAEPPALWAGLEPGPVRVGYRHMEAVDVWYPSKADGDVMTFRDYLHGHGEDLEKFLAAQGLSRDAIAAFIDGAVYARANATMLTSPHPLVLIAQGNGEDAADQAILSEFLASHGYVVASVPSPMIAHRMTSETEIGTFAEEQKAALEMARHVVSEQFHIRKGHEAVVGHSFGARAALLLAMQERSIRAIVSLDGGIGTATGVQYLKEAPSFRMSRRLPPLLHVYETLDEFLHPDFRFMESLDLAGLKLQQTGDMHHIHFTTYGFAAAVVPDIAKVTKAGPRVRDDVIATAQAVLTFIDGKLGVRERARHRHGATRTMRPA